MKHNNYNNYSKKRNEVVKPEPEVTVTNVEDEVDVTPVHPEPEVTVTNIEDEVPVGCIHVQANITPVQPEPELEPTIGIVEGCKRLNIRANPNPSANVLAIVDEGKELEIDIDKSTIDWYSVCTASGVEGYCMKQFVTIK